MKRIVKYALTGAVALAGIGLLAPDGLFSNRAVAEMAISKDSPGAPVVVELFTSQGCSSCPPADELLGELAGQPGVLALEMHVDYWDYIGWEDLYATPAITDRQRSYMRDLGLRYVYTPQMVIDGHDDVIGSHRGSVLKKIDAAAAKPKPVRVTVDPANGGRVLIGEGHAPEDGATVWLVTFDREHKTPVKRGENAGETLSNYHVVREMDAIGHWNGAALEIALDLQGAAAAGRDGCAIIVQTGATGPVLGAAMMFLDG